MSILLPAISAGVSLIGSLVGGISSLNQQKKADQDLQRRRDESQRRFLQESNTNYLDTAAAKSTIATLRKQGEKQLNALNTDAVKKGASDEAKVAAASRINENQADSISRLAGFGTQYQQQIKDRYYRDVERLDDALYNSQINKAQTTAGMIDGITGAAGSFLSAWGTGAFDKTKSAPAKFDNATLGKVENAIKLPNQQVSYGYKHPMTGQWIQK